MNDASRHFSCICMSGHACSSPSFNVASKCPLSPPSSTAKDNCFWACGVQQPVCDLLVPFVSKNILSYFLFFSFALSVWTRLDFISHRRWILPKDFTMASPAPLFFCYNWTSVQPEKASTRIWMNLFPSWSAGVKGPVVSEETAFSKEYLLFYSCLNRALAAFILLHGGHVWFSCAVLSLFMWSMASGNSFRIHSMTFLFAWLMAACLFVFHRWSHSWSVSFLHYGPRSF